VPEVTETSCHLRRLRHLVTCARFETLSPAQALQERGRGVIHPYSHQ
jgi:hypothetical protein